MNKPGIINTIRKINNYVVKPPTSIRKVKRKHFPGYKLFLRPNFTALMIAPSGIGKTVVLSNILLTMLPANKKRSYKLFLFVRTLHTDGKWIQLLNDLKKRGIEITTDTSLDSLPDTLRVIQREKGDGEHEFKKYFIISDDQAEDNRTRVMNNLCKTARHNCCTFLSCQSIKDICPSARTNSHVILLFGKLDNDTLFEVYKNLRLRMTFKHFTDLYDYVHQEPYNILYYDRVENQFRKNFNEVININDIGRDNEVITSLK
jgi:hypothetical protein